MIDRDSDRVRNREKSIEGEREKELKDGKDIKIHR